MILYYIVMCELFVLVVWAFCYMMFVPRIAMRKAQGMYMRMDSDMPPQMWAALGDD